jgi:hypothetical protein
MRLIEFADFTTCHRRPDDEAEHSIFNVFVHKPFNKGHQVRNWTRIKLYTNLMLAPLLIHSVPVCAQTHQLDTSIEKRNQLEERLHQNANCKETLGLRLLCPWKSSELRYSNLSMKVAPMPYTLRNKGYSGVSHQHI